MTVSVPAALAVALIVVVAAFQIGLVAGAPWGAAAWGGSHPGTLPTRLRAASVSSLLILAAFAWVILAADGAVEAPVSARVIDIAIWVVAGYFLLGTLANAVSRSKPERWWAPVAFVTGICAILVALN